MKIYSEEETLRQIQSGEPELQRKAFEQVVSFYSEKLYYQIRKLVLSHDDANDLLQNTFMKAWMNINLFRGEARISTWLYKIALNESITFLNKQNAQNNIVINEQNAYLLDRLESDSYFDGDALQKRLQQAIISLPEKQRIVFNLRYYDEMPYEEMSQVLNTSVGALKASYHHAAKKVEDFLNKD
ncbi:MAG: sigma-70 family RNA polymerase sigma factor [Dysgonamonadaceae bacterium]|jgi:RNA polymerase sigma-70 factor (ECF subfamily)|nr:sigma-70 family RNA polymerase sigma factor [Dysgonamonadaceae bacterium]